MGPMSSMGPASRPGYLGSPFPPIAEYGFLSDYDAEHILLRTVRCVNGEVQLSMDCEPVFDYGRTFGAWSYTESGYHQGKCSCASTDVELTLTSDMNIGFE